ncbi:hypothetical protein OSB04_015457 [Centaurea solstitialis]|uniref:TIR domain-containing protein n=1 Tax=Centaurea solstitialis TaxID=347529 RepID=A0AA38THC5_9ASTR|nr:hypothetical protein OSB04_015457 [Centaurea solstitialis]
MPVCCFWETYIDFPPTSFLLIPETSFYTAFPPIPIMASSSSSASIKNYDVFLSFRGKDTRNSFTDHLYKKLMDAEINTFKDNEDINIGEKLNPKIQRAIRESKGSIVVLSQNYATSTWCLDELWLILQQRRDYDHFVIPIFYHVDPSDVREQNKAFNIEIKVSSRWTEENVNKWKAALREIADLKGSKISGPETEFLKIIVDVTNQNLDHKDVQCPPNLIGVTARYEEISSWLNQPNSQFLTICGMGGSGKTTLAKYIYESNRKLFENRTSFLKDIARRCEEHNGLFKVQEELFNDILRCTERNKHTQRMCKFVKALKVKKTLIVLDDIGDTDLSDLLGYGEINAQSKIIITNRKNADNWFQFTDERRCEHHEMKLLNDVESLRLLSLRAFGNETPKRGFEELAVEAVNYCEGNPLALNVLASSLSERDTIHQWRSHLSLLEKDIDDKIQGVLRRSYMSLPEEYSKKLFLHIACFFVGEDMDYVEKILDPDYAAVSGIQTLIRRYLLSVSPNKKLTMHRLIQEMARKIVRQESFHEPAQRSRVWDNHESYKILRREKGSETIEGLALDMRMLATNQKHAFKSSDLKSDAINKMDNLKLLQLNFVKLTGSYENFSEDLRWLCWHGYHQITIPSDLFMGNMVSLDMSNSKLEVFEPPMNLQALQILNMKDSNNLLEIRNISRIPNLETFILWNCHSLVHVCETIGDLKGLVVLNMTGCENLFKREQINFLVGLNASTSGQQVTKQPPFSFPTSLEKLFLNTCNLECTELFPSNFSVQQSLQYLNLSNNLLEFMPCYDHLENLRVLDLSFCKRLKRLLSLPSTLAELYVYYCKSLEKITFQSHRFTLQEFGYGGCSILSEIEDFLKLVPIAKQDETSLGHLKWLKKYQSHEVLLVGDDELTKGRSLKVQMLYEFNIWSTSLPDIKDANMTPDYISESSSLSFDVSLCPKRRRLKGLNVIIKYTLSGEDWAWFAKISTTNGDDLIYNPKVFGKPGSSEVAIWLSYWPIGSTIEVGDNISVSIVTKIGLEVHECGASLVYADDEEVDDTMEKNVGWVETLGGYLPGFQLSTGAYYLCRRDFFELMEVGRLTPGWFSVLVGDTVDYTGVSLLSSQLCACTFAVELMLQTEKVSLISNIVTEIQGWRKTGRLKELNPSSTEVKTFRCIICGPEQEEFYKIAEMSKSSSVDKIVEFISSILGETMESEATSEISDATTKVIEN